MAKKREKIVKCDLGMELVESAAAKVDALLKTLPSECTYRKKALVSQTEAVDGERASIAMVTTEALDRDNEIILAKGIDTTQYIRNGPVCWNHDWSALPIGKCKWVKKVANGLRAMCVFSERPPVWEGPWLPDAVLALVRQEVIKAVSIGALPTKLRLPTREEIEKRPELKNCECVIEECVMLEYSYVTLPSNPDALCEALRKGFKPDAASLKLLGLNLPKVVKRRDSVKQMVHLLEQIRINPERIAALALEQLKARGRI